MPSTSPKAAGVLQLFGSRSCSDWARAAKASAVAGGSCTALPLQHGKNIAGVLEWHPAGVSQPVHSSDPFAPILSVTLAPSELTSACLGLRSGLSCGLPELAHL